MSDGRVIIDTTLDSSGAEKGIGKLNNIASKGLKGISIAIIGVGAALTGIGVYAVSVGMKFETGMSKVKAISGATAEDMEKLANKAKEMGSTTKFSATESADALSYMALAGWKTNDMLDGLPGIMDLAAASGEELGSVSDIVTDSLTAFGMKASESGHFADVLAKASSNSNTNVAMLGESFKYVAPLAGALGYNVEDATVALGLMANSGIKASKSGTSLKTALVNMAKPTAKMKKVMDKYNLSLSNADGTMKPLSQVTEELRSKLGGLDKSTQAAAAATLFGKESLAGMLAVVNASPEDYEKLTGAINNSDGAAKKMADTMNDNLKGKLTIMGSALEGIGLQIYEKLEGPLKNAAETALESLGNISKSLSGGELGASVDKLAEGFGSLITSIAEGIEKWLPKIIKAFTWMMDNSNAIATGIVGIGTALLVMNVANMVMGLVKAFQAAKLVTEGLTVSQWLLNAAMTANPIGLIVAVIVGVIAAIVYLWKTNEDFRTFWIGVWQAISEFFVGVWTAIIAFFTETIPTVFNNFIAIVSALPGKIGAFFTNIYNDFINWGAGVLAWVATTIPEIINSVITFFNELPGKIGFALGFALGTIIKWGIAAFNYLVTNVPIWIKSVVTFFSQLPSKIWTWLLSTIVKIATWGSRMYSKMTSAVSNAITAVINWFAKLPGRVWTWLLSTIAKVAQFASNLGSKAKQAGSDMVSNIISSVASLPGKMASVGSNIVKGVWNGIKGLGGWLKSKVGDFFGGIVDGAKNALGIHSPSRIFRDQVGAMMAKGVGVGFEDESESIEDKMKNNLSDLTAKMKSTVDFETAKTTAMVAAQHNYKVEGTTTANESSKSNNNQTFIAKLIVDGKEFTQTVVAPNQGVLTSWGDGR